MTSIGGAENGAYFAYPHEPLAALTSTPASCHSESSFLWVPLSSPREVKSDLVLAMADSEAMASLLPLMPAGSDAGPTMMKSLYMTSWRVTPLPSATNCSSDALW
jgi:hypothetical protein